MPFSSLYDFGKYKRIQYRHNSAEDQALQRKQAALNRLHGPPRPDTSFAGRTQQTGADYLPPFARCDDTKGPRRPKTQSGATSDMPSRIAVDGPRPPGSPLHCLDDCPSKKFYDPSSCALESVREANAIAEKLRRAE